MLFPYGASHVLFPCVALVLFPYVVSHVLVPLIVFRVLSPCGDYIVVVPYVDSLYMVFIVLGPCVVFRLMPIVCWLSVYIFVCCSYVRVSSVCLCVLSVCLFASWFLCWVRVLIFLVSPFLYWLCVLFFVCWLRVLSFVCCFGTSCVVPCVAVGGDGLCVVVCVLVPSVVFHPLLQACCYMQVSFNIHIHIRCHFGSSVCSMLRLALLASGLCLASPLVVSTIVIFALATVFANSLWLLKDFHSSRCPQPLERWQ